ncbi:MAG: iron ABC transporter permease [Burkholderiaceae bacterium]|nr:iron ABC transporter permease [Burkholderiaceae bacterium]
MQGSDRRWLYAALPALLLAVTAAALLIGSAGVDLDMIRNLRAPRVAAAAGVGALLALAGLAMQSLLRNPLADPYVLGTSGGAAVGALLALMFGITITAGAAAGALAAGALLLWLARRAMATTDDASPRLILAGAMLAALFGAMASLLLALTPDQRLRGAIFWLVGDLSGADDGGVSLAAAAAFAAWFVGRERALDRLLLGSVAAHLLGEPVRRLRFELLLGASLAAALAVASAGAIGFVGLVAPHALRLSGVQRTRDLALLSPLGGAALVVVADLLARTVALPIELPVGAVMALIGAPVFVWFLARGER